jgi:hypothetical protein
MKRALFSAAISIAMIGFVCADDKGTVVEIDGLKAIAPAAWKKDELPKGPMFKSRKYQFKIDKVAGDPENAELRVILLQGEGGGVDANIDRWKKEFKAPAGDKAKVEKFQVNGVDVVMVDIEGTYLSKFPPFAPDAKITEKDNWRIINVMFNSKNGPYFFKLMGPAKTVGGQRKAFEEWVKSFK